MTSMKRTATDAARELNASDPLGEFAMLDSDGCCFEDLSRPFRASGAVNGAHVSCMRCGSRWAKAEGTWVPWPLGSVKP